MTRIDIIRNCFFCKSLFTFKNNEAETRTQCIQNKSNLKCIFNKNLLPYYSKVNLIREVYPKLCIVKNISALFWYQAEQSSIKSGNYLCWLSNFSLGKLLQRNFRIILAFILTCIKIPILFKLQKVLTSSFLSNYEYSVYDDRKNDNCISHWLLILTFDSNVRCTTDKCVIFIWKVGELLSFIREEYARNDTLS